MTRGRPLTSLVLPLLCVATVAYGTWGALTWSLIPLQLDGRIQRVQFMSESGYRWRILTLDDGTRLVIDGRVTHPLGDWDELPGQPIEKGTGDRAVRIGDRTWGLAPSTEMWKVLGVLTGVSALVLWRWRRHSEGATPGGATTDADR